MIIVDKFITKEEMLNYIEDTDIEWINTKDGEYKVNYANVRSSMDIENSSFFISKETGETYTMKYFRELGRQKDGKKLQDKFLETVDKVNITYAIMFGFEGKAVLFRKWDEYIPFMCKVGEILDLSFFRRLPIYIHNLSHEFQYMKDRYSWDRVFAREKRSPMKALTSTGLEYRCSYVLSGMSLEMTAKNITKYKIEKKKGDLDYDLLHTPETPLTDEEKGYCIYDVLIVMALIDEEIDTWGDITKIPMTNTGKVRKHCKQVCLGKYKWGQRNKYQEMIHKLNISGTHEYELLKEAFMGGFTHASCLKVGKVWENVKSFDFTSSYPAVICYSKNFPVGSGVPIKLKSIEEILRYGKTACIISNITFKNVITNIDYEHYWSASKSRNENGIPLDKISVKEQGDLNIVFDNGRIVQSDYMNVTLTELDLEDFVKAYSFDEYVINESYIYAKGYIPKELIKCVLDFYEGKTTLKDVPGKEREYLHKKGMLNSIYGDFVTDIINYEIEYNGDWISNEDLMTYADKEQFMAECIEDYNNSKTRYGFYPMGIYTTSIARHNLWSAIFECKEDYIYSDTDSVKILNYDKHKEYFDNYNKNVEKQLKEMCDFYGIDFERCHPKTIKGKEKMLGVWDDDGTYTKLKTLGSKRYLVEYIEDGEKHIKCTIAGVNKKETSKWLSQQKDPFETFNDNMTVPEDYSGRLICTYLDEEMEGDCVDYLGHKYHYREMSSVHMQPGEYNLTLNPLYKEFLKVIEKVQY